MKTAFLFCGVALLAIWLMSKAFEKDYGADPFNVIPDIAPASGR